MINADNYYSKAGGIDFSALPSALQKGSEFVDKLTEKGSSWSKYHESPTIQKVVDEYFKKLDQHISEKPKEKEPEKKEEKKPEKKDDQKPVLVKKEKKESKPKPQPARKEKEADRPEPEPEFVERIPDELRFMRRYLNLHYKRKSKEDLLRFINALQKAILERRIRKVSPWAKQIKYMQENLLKVYNGMKGHSVEIEIKPDVYAEFKSEIEGEKPFKSIQLIKRYVNLHGKTGIKEKAKKLFDEMNRAVQKKKISIDDKYAGKLNEVWLSLKEFLQDKSKKILPLNSAELNGLLGLLGECGCDLGGIDSEPKENKVMSSTEFAQMQFDSIGFTGKWLDLIGDPAPGFTAMVFGKPKMGKSYLCVEFAGHLAQNFGKVLYVAREESFSKTLQKKLNDKQVIHPNLFVSDSLPQDLSEYAFIFIDSVNKLGLKPSDLDALRKKNPGKSFIFVFQTTKDGNFRGKNEFQHDVDVVIEVPEMGKAVQFGRYNQGGEMEIFKET